MRSMALGAAALALAAAAAAAAAQTSDQLLASATLQHAPEADGTSVSAAWLQSVGRELWLAGAERTRIGGDHWTLARIGATRPLGARRNLIAQLDIGPANVGGEHFVFKKAFVDATAASGERWSMRLSDTYVDVQPQHGH